MIRFRIIVSCNGKGEKYPMHSPRVSLKFRFWIVVSILGASAFVSAYNLFTETVPLQTLALRSVIALVILALFYWLCAREKFFSSFGEYRRLNPPPASQQRESRK